MTGKELRVIRMFNGISQEELALKLKYSTRDTIRKAESMDFLPQKYVQTISELVGYDFGNDNKLKEYISKIPEEYFIKYTVKRKRSYDMFGILRKSFF